MSGTEDTDITDFFIDNAFLTQQEVRQIIAALERSPEGLSEPQLLAQVNIRQNRLSQGTKMLALEAPAPIVKQGSKWQLTAARLSDGFWDRAEQLTALPARKSRRRCRNIWSWIPATWSS